MPSENAFKSAFRFGHSFLDIQQSRMLLVLEKCIRIGSCGKAEVFRLCKRHLVLSFKRGQKFICLLRCRNVNYFISVSENKAVKICHKRCADLLMLGYVKAHKSKVKRLLSIFRIGLYPSAVKLGKGIPLVAVYIPRQSR